MEESVILQRTSFAIIHGMSAAERKEREGIVLNFYAPHTCCFAFFAKRTLHAANQSKRMCLPIYLTQIFTFRNLTIYLDAIFAPNSNLRFTSGRLSSDCFRFARSFDLACWSCVRLDFVRSSESWSEVFRRCQTCRQDRRLIFAEKRPFNEYDSEGRGGGRGGRRVEEQKRLFCILVPKAGAEIEKDFGCSFGRLKSAEQTSSIEAARKAG